MLKVKLTPDDVLTGAGTYREAVEVECPVCGDITVYKTEQEKTDCGSCGKEFGVEKPFN
jgi:ribosomal protein S27E